MNYQTKWDSGLIKKFGSTNHFRLLNQLRNEIKAYPIKRKTEKIKVSNNTSLKTQMNEVSQLPNYNQTRDRTNNNNLSPENITANNDIPNNIYKSNHNDMKYNKKDNKIFNNTNTNNEKLKNQVKDSAKFPAQIADSKTDLNYDLSNRENEVTNKENTKNNNPDYPSTPSQYEESFSNTEQPIEVPITFLDRLSQIDMR